MRLVSGHDGVLWGDTLDHEGLETGPYYQWCLVCDYVGEDGEIIDWHLARAHNFTVHPSQECYIQKQRVVPLGH